MIEKSFKYTVRDSSSPSFNSACFYLWTKAIPPLCRWQRDAAVGRASCVWASPPSDNLYSSSKHLSTCAETRDRVQCLLKWPTFKWRSILFVLLGTTLQALWVWQLILPFFASGTDFKRLLHLLEHLFRRPEGQRFVPILHTSTGKTKDRTEQR